MNLSQDSVVRFQLLRLVLVLAGLLFFFWLAQSSRTYFVPWGLWPLLGLLFLGAGFFLFSRKRQERRFLWVELLADVVLVSLLIKASGGRGSAFVFLYPLIIFIGTLHLGRRGADILTSLTLLAYLVVFWWPHPPRLTTENLLQFFITVGAMGLSGLLALRFAEEIDRSQRQAEETRAALYRIEELYQHIMRSMASGLLITDLKGVVTSSNKKAREILGPGIEGQRLTDLLPGLNLEEEQHRGELSLRRDNKRIFLGYSLFPLRDESERAFGYGLLFQDITHIKEQEEKLRQAEHQAALGTMAAGLVHEIKNPLASISGAIQLLKENQLVASEGKRLLEILERGCVRLDELVTNFLFFAKPGGGERRKLSLKKLCQELLEELSCDPLLARVELSLVLPDVYIKVDPGRFKQILANLLLNAAQALQEIPSPRIEISFEQRERDFWALIVKDNGPGIAPDILPRIFEPFFTTKEDGTGLGLSVVYSLVRAWGGHIEVNSQPGQGATFRLLFPKELLS